MSNYLEVKIKEPKPPFLAAIFFERIDFMEDQLQIFDNSLNSSKFKIENLTSK